MRKIEIQRKRKRKRKTQIERDRREGEHLSEWTLKCESGIVAECLQS